MSTILLLLALAAPVIAPQADHAGNRIEPLAVAVTQPALHCTADQRWCVQIGREGERSSLRVSAGLPGAGGEILIHDLPDDLGEASLNLWPQIVRSAEPDGGVLIGVETSVSTMYSGGGGGATELTLFRVAQDAKPVLTVPVAGSLMIRACFSERDMRARRDACHDEYNFSGTLKLDLSTTSGPPRFRFETEATSFPRGASRNEDSLARGPLRQRDLVPVRDEACSYARFIAFDPASELYEPDRPLPDCSDYTVP